jgi:hypothetical protein
MQVIIGDTFSSLAAFYLGPDSMFAQRQIILVVLGLGVCLPLCLPRNLSALGESKQQMWGKTQELQEGCASMGWHGAMQQTTPETS